jgi:hemerythrin-like domain-containing protein
MRTETARQVKKRAARRAPPRHDAIALLKKDHAAVSEMFRQYDKLTDKSGDEGKGELAAKICEELTIHTTIEEEILYPALREALGEELLMDEAQVEHNSAKALIAEIEAMQPGDEMYDAKVTVLGEFIKHHVKEEHEEMFPKARKAKLDLAALGEQLAARRQALIEAASGVQ